MRKTRYYIVLIALILLVGGYFLTQYAKIQEKRIENLEEHIAFLKAENVPVKFRIDEKTDTLIKVTIKFYDLDDNEIAKTQQEVYGEELSFDFSVIPVKDKYVAFPHKLFSDQIAPKNGILLTDFYDKQEFPQIFHHSKITSEAKEAFTLLFEQLKTDSIHRDSKQFGNMVHDIKQIKSFQEGYVYKIVVHTKGGIEVLEN